MTPDDYQKNSEVSVKIHLLDEYRSQIVLWLKDYPGLSAAQVNDWLKEYYAESFSQRTVSRYVKTLCAELKLPKKTNVREYLAVPDSPHGKQVVYR